MVPERQFRGLSNEFWAYVKLISEQLGYAERGDQSGGLRRYTPEQIGTLLYKMELETSEVMSTPTSPTQFGREVCDYLNYRAQSLEEHAKSNLMDREEARLEFERLRSALNPTCPLPMNKQRGEKRHHAYLTCIVNMLTEKALGGRPFVADPRRLTLLTGNRRPIHTGSRWMDGAYPDAVDAVAVWEIKEHYGTTTFGSRVSAAVYETMLDGFELAELQRRTGRTVHHYLIVDDFNTWWTMGRSYLCRIVDLMHCGLLDEALFGREVLSRWPGIVADWL